MRLTLHSKNVAAEVDPAATAQDNLDQTPSAPERGAGAKARPPQPLVFESDAGASWPHWIAGFICLALVVWMASGMLSRNAAPSQPPAVTGSAARVSVAVQPSTASSVTRYFRGEGYAVPDRETTLRAEMSGHVSQLYVKKGQIVAKGQVIAQLDPAQRAADLQQAQANLDRAVQEFETAQALLKKGASTARRVGQERANLATARAQVAAAQQGLAQTKLVAPFGGRIEWLGIDLGEYVQEGAELARVVDTTPLTVSVRVPQQMAGELQVGAPAAVQFITGEQRTGEIIFVGLSADNATRTFPAEISVANPDRLIPAGISARVQVPIGEVTAHFLSPAILSLGRAGELGIKTVDPENRVVFTEVEIAQAQSDGIWVTGLPEQVRLITIGQGFVTAGETVIPMDAGTLTGATE